MAHARAQRLRGRGCEKSPFHFSRWRLSPRCVRPMQALVLLPLLPAERGGGRQARGEAWQRAAGSWAGCFGYLPKAAAGFGAAEAAACCRRCRPKTSPSATVVGAASGVGCMPSARGDGRYSGGRVAPRRNCSGVRSVAPEGEVCAAVAVRPRIGSRGGGMPPLLSNKGE